MPEKDGSEDKKSTKSVINKKQKQFMNQEEQLDLSSVAESFGGQIVGEPEILNEMPAILAVPAIGAGIFGTGAVGYDSYQKLRGKKGILPDMSGVVKKVYDKIRGVYRSTTRTDQEDSSGTSGGTEQQRKYRNKRRRNLEGPDYSDTSSRTGDLKSGRYKYNKNNNQSNKNNNNKFSKRDSAIGFGSGLGTSTAISTLTKSKRKGGGGFRLGGLPGTAHNVGRRTNPQ